MMYVPSKTSRAACLIPVRQWWHLDNQALAPQLSLVIETLWHAKRANGVDGSIATSLARAYRLQPSCPEPLSPEVWAETGLSMPP